jgi:hypothetical protein
MNRTWLALLLVIAGCGNSNNNGDGGAINPSVSLVSPSTVFLGRTVDVHLSGFGTAWTDSTTVDFGDGVTVNKVTAASDTGLTANITIASTATVGARDVSVMDGSNNEVFKSTFAVSSPIKVTFLGSVAQGSIADVQIELLDKDNPFDATAQSSLLGGTTYTNLAFKKVSGVGLAVNSATPFAIDALIFVDVDAPAGMANLELVSGPPGGTTISNLVPNGINVVARTAATLPTGNTDGTISNAFDSSLYTLTPGSGTNVAQLAVTTTDAKAQPSFALLPKSGHFADLIAFTASQTFVTSTTDPYYVVVWENTGATNFPFTLNRAENLVNAINETEPNNTAPGNAVTLPALASATLSSETDIDVFSFTVTAADAGKKIHVVTFGDSGGATAVDVRDKTNTSITTMGGPLDPGDYVDFTTKALTAAEAGIVTVHVTDGSQFGSPATPGAYNVWIRLE